ncbi:CCA tRNA nucleotidyltransferase [Acholeplasma equirhinis]|uniref:CCA tRNA nucleotidyltransferase n=1 Tax=Acholeplasma equirhinis TaxID=555393 RepID=UPI00197A86D1|nr:CCA tRNA nucleotidyltransferase [Acholeplasma equirhinis]MBN3490843.1 CCA tRNA nucleotidyltransferase [Acholeplasma equirhinis]
MSLNAAKKLIKDLKRKGHQAYMVGGVVRDFLMKSKFSDIDITTSAKPYEVMKLFKTVPTGLKYGTVTVLYDNAQFEVTTFRQDGPTSDFRHPDSVIYSDNVNDDVQRRDFTINGILMDDYQNIYDYVGGQQDIINKIIRTIGDPDQRFNEDALRMLRAIYFQSKLGFIIEEETKRSIRRNRHLIQELPMERVHTEMIKILKGEHLKTALESMIETGLDEVLPGLEKGIKYAATLDLMPYVDPFFALAFTLNNGIVPAEWPFSNIHRNKYQKAAELALKTKEFIDDVNLYHYGLEISILANKVNAFRGIAKHAEKKIIAAYEALPVKSELDLALTSQEILDFKNKKPGAWLGILKKQMIEDILLKKVSNDKNSLYKYLESKA